MKIAIARLRYSVRYTRPLDDIMDSFYDSLRTYMENNPQHTYSFYNITFDGTKPVRNIAAVENADVILIPSENEFHAWVPNYLHPMNLAKVNEHIEKLKPALAGKHIVILSSDRADSIDLYRNFTLKDVPVASLGHIDEDEFPVGIHSMKYHNLTTDPDQELNTPLFVSFTDPNQRRYDFTYWGTLRNKLPGGAKSNDPRRTVLKVISKQSDINCFWVGRFDNIDRNLPMVSMRRLFPYLRNSTATLCFNWLDTPAITSRYHEAMAAGCIPLVWKTYDHIDRLKIIPWQRCYSQEEVVAKIRELQDQTTYKSRFAEISSEYHRILPSVADTKNRFATLLDQRLAIVGQPT